VREDRNSTDDVGHWQDEERIREKPKFPQPNSTKHLGSWQTDSVERPRLGDAPRPQPYISNAIQRPQSIHVATNSSKIFFVGNQGAHASTASEQRPEGAVWVRLSESNTDTSASTYPMSLAEADPCDAMRSPSKRDSMERRGCFFVKNVPFYYAPL